MDEDSVWPLSLKNRIPHTHRDRTPPPRGTFTSAPLGSQDVHHCPLGVTLREVVKRDEAHNMVAKTGSNGLEKQNFGICPEPVA